MIVLQRLIPRAPLIKAIPALTLALLVGATGPVAAQESTELEGDWERIFMRFVLPDTTIEETYETGPRLTKILTATHFAFGEQSEDGKEVFAGGGRYTLKDSLYIEVYEYHSSHTMVGRTISFETKLEGGLWYISGVIGRFRLEETWRRLR